MNRLVHQTEWIGDMLTNWPVGTISFVLMVAIAFGILRVCWWILKLALDPHITKQQRGTGRVIRKTFTPAWIEDVCDYNPVLEMNESHKHHHPDKWEIHVKLPTGTGKIEVGSDTYENLRLHQDIEVDYTVGYFTQWVHLKRVHA